MQTDTEASEHRPPGQAAPAAAASPRKTTLRRTWPWWLGLTAAFAVGVCIDTAQLRTWMAREAVAPASAATSPRAGGASRAQPVSIGVVRRQDMRMVVNAIGTIAPFSTTVVRSRIDGELKALHYQEGQPVKAGQLLAEIDDRPFQIALAQAQGTLARDRAALDSARRDAARFRDLLSKDGIARQPVEQQESLAAQLEGTVQADQAQVENAKLQLSYTRILAPISGVAGLKQVDAGNLVRANDPSGLLVINQMQPVNVVFAVPELHLPRIRQRLAQREPLPVEAWDREQKTRWAVGRVATLDNAIDAATGTIKLKAAFENADGKLFPNQFVNVRLQLDTLPDVVAVPSIALMRAAQGSYVFVVNADDSVSIRSVQAGEADGDWTSVRADLQPGDRVVTDGTDRLREGSKVQVIERSLTASGRSAASAPTASTTATAPTASATSAAPTAPAAQTASPSAAALPVAPPSPLHRRRRRLPSAPHRKSARRQRHPPRRAANGRHGSTNFRPTDAAKVMQLSPEQRQAWLRKHLEQRARVEAEAMASPNPPDWMKRLPPDVVERLQKLSPEKRQAWLLKRMLERVQQ